MDHSPQGSHYVQVNGIQLHYLDWGGSGETLLFLAGYGCNAHIFESLAPRFADKFRVLGVTRRGHGQSEHPPDGYEVDSLTEDIRQFLEALKIDKVTLVGHSMSNIELCRFTALHPECVSRLVFLDAAYDRSNESYRQMVEANPIRKIKAPGSDRDFFSEDEYLAAQRLSSPWFAAVWCEAMDRQSRHELMKTPEGKVIERMSEAIAAAITTAMTVYAPEEVNIQVPTLAFFTFHNGPYYISNDWMSEDQKRQILEFFEGHHYDWVRENIERFRRNVPQARIVELPKGHHYCFLRMEERVYEEMSRFLEGTPAHQ